MPCPLSPANVRQRPSNTRRTQAIQRLLVQGNPRNYRCLPIVRRPCPLTFAIDKKFLPGETCPPAKSRVSCQRAGSRFASSGPSARRGNGERLAVAQERDPPGERGAGGLTVAQRWRSPRCGNAQDARCSSDHAQAGGRWMNHDHAFFRNGKSHSLRKRRSVPKKIISGRAKPAPLESLMPMRSIVHAKSAT